MGENALFRSHLSKCKQAIDVQSVPVFTVLLSQWLEIQEDHLIEILAAAGRMMEQPTLVQSTQRIPVPRS